MLPVPDRHPLRQWFSGLVQNTFHAEVGLCQPALVDYVADLLVDFLHTERINILPDGSGRRVEDIAVQMLDMESGLTISSEIDRCRLIHRHIGDFTLFWTGVYPENLRRMHRRAAEDALITYFHQGRRSYGIASDLSTDQTEPPAAVLRQLSEQFEQCVYGLALVRKTWEHGDGPDFEAINKR